MLVPEFQMPFYMVLQNMLNVYGCRISHQQKNRTMFCTIQLAHQILYPYLDVRS